MHRSRRLGVLPVLLLAACLDTAASDTARDADTPPEYEPQVRYTLLHPDSSADARNAALKTTFEIADAGNGSAAYQLAALFRSGPEHPARATPRDPDTARYWLERCLTQRWCPRVTFAAMAELLLELDKPQEAMSWAQAAALAERETMAKIEAAGLGARGQRNQAYHAALLKRIFGRLPREQTRDEVVQAEFHAWLAQLGGVMDRLVAAEVEGLRRYRDDASLTFDTSDRRMLKPAEAAQAAYLLRVPPGSAAPDASLMIDGLPSPQKARSLDRIAASLRVVPYVAVEGEAFRYAVAPIELDDGRFALKKNRVNARN